MDRARDSGNSSPSISLGPVETEVMNLVWEMGEVTVRDVYRVLLTRRAIAYTTVMTIMSNLTGKGVLERRRQNRAYVYTPVLSNDEFTRNKIDEIVVSTLNRFTETAMTYLVDRMAKVDPRRLSELEKAIVRLRNKETEIPDD
ncbi:MAG: BlaI/MecI/CopY family transcriptional regulator [Dehalococcoidales bacterium]|nr:BlaI/MecI/CopY family transcriptional regulator [Dehalococcoidales bacterium]